MRFADLLGTAIGNLGRHKLRTILTVAGVTIGTTTLALMVSVAAGLQIFVVEQTRALMSNDLVFVTTSQDVGNIRISLGSVGAPAEEVKDTPQSRAAAMTPEQLARLRSIPHVRGLYPNFWVRSESIRLDGGTKAYQVSVSAVYPGSRTVELVAGRGFGGDEREVILSNQYMTVFGWATPEEALGKWVAITVSRVVPARTVAVGAPPKMEKEQFRARIVGMSARTAEGKMAWLPYEYALEMGRWQLRNRQMFTPSNWGATGILQVDSSESVEEVARAARAMGMGVLTPADQLGIVNTAYMYLEGVLSVFGLIALAVASLGISNTLVMAIYERTREIGVWKALGATKRTIRALFTVEAGAIGLAGGITGLSLAWVIGQGINAVARATFAREYSSFALSAFPLWLVLAVLGISTLIGVVAGLLPANRAAGLDPVAALRQE